MHADLSQLYVLYRHHQYQQVIARSAAYPITDPAYYPAQLLKLRALQALGLLEQAYQYSRQWLEQGIPDGKWAACFQLWHTYLLISRRQPTDLEPTLTYFEQVSQQPASDAYTMGLAYDLMGRALSTGIVVQLLSAVEHKARVEACWQLAAAHYQASRAADEYVGVMKLLAQLLAQPPLADRARARATYEQLVALENGELFALARVEAGLAIAEDDFVQWQARRPVDELAEYERIRQVFRDAEAVFERAAYTWGYAWVAESLGSLLLRYGDAAGELLLGEAERRYQRGSFATDRQRVLRLLGSWYETRGEEARFRQTELIANSLDVESEFTISRQVATLNIAHLASRTGNYGEVQRICDEALHQPSVVWLRIHFILLRTIALGTLGRKDKLEAAQQLVHFLEPRGSTSTLADALQQQADFLFEQADDQQQELAAQAMRRVLRIDEQLGDSRAQAGHLIVFSEFLLKGQLACQQALTVTATIEQCWEQAWHLLADDPTYAGALLRCSLQQAIGQQLFQIRNYEAARRLFASAGQELTRIGARGRPLFLYLYQGNVEIQTARTLREAPPYVEALRLFALAETLVQAMDLADVRWRIAFNQGICLRELGQLALSPAQSQPYWDQADAAYATAHDGLFRLMLTADYRAGETQHASRAGFLGNRQSVYRQAFFLNLLERRQLWRALQWLDRMKSQALLAAVRGKGLPAAGQVLEPQFYDLDWPTLERNLRTQETLLQRRIHVFAYYFTKDYQTLLCFAAGDAAPQAVELHVSFADLQQLKSSVFQAPGGVRLMADEGTDEHWFRFSDLVQPVEARAAPGDVVILIPHGLLHDLPLHTLRTDSHSHLLERNPVSYHLSLALLSESLAGVAPASPLRGEVFGDSRANLAGSRTEAEFVAQHLGLRPLLGAAASRQSFLAAFSDAAIIHFAGHGQFHRQEGMDQHLVLAADELVTARDLIALPSAAYLLVLSGCETGISEYRSGDELFGLVRAALSAGVATVIASQWPVNDAATRRFFDSFYASPFTGQPGEKVLALQRAATRLLAAGCPLYEWGSFTLTGAL